MTYMVVCPAVGRAYSQNIAPKLTIGALKQVFGDGAESLVSTETGPGTMIIMYGNVTPRRGRVQAPNLGIKMYTDDDVVGPAVLFMLPAEGPPFRSMTSREARTVTRALNRHIAAE